MASVGGFVNASSYKSHQMKNRSKSKVYCVSSSKSATDPYQTLMIPRGASESDVKKAFRRLALKYHPDVCRGNDCGVQFHRIYQAYDVLMDKLKEEAEMEKVESSYDPEEMWDEWMGYEGAGIRDYSNPYN